MNTRIVQLSDIHIGSPYSFRYRPACLTNFKQAMKQVEAFDVQPKLIVLSGDLTRDGETHRFELTALKELLATYPYEFHLIPGNHDVGGRFELDRFETISEEKVVRYKSVFDDKFEVVVDDVRLIGFNSFLLGTNFSAEDEQWEWLQEKANEKGSWKKQLWFMHNLPYRESPFETKVENKEDEYGAWYAYIDLDRQHRLMKIIKDSKVDVIACGHSHYFKDRTVDGIRHVNCPATGFCVPTSKLGFVVYDINENEIVVNQHLLDVESPEVEFGVGGHIPFDKRDYSLGEKMTPAIAEEVNALLHQ
ncbi:MAG: hypothetical protein COA79_04615 [Planctomycetota bacterium]|nr:MAG: hypothetical protein COA79_04615 [Planctomycetota bacterium]